MILFLVLLSSILTIGVIALIYIVWNLNNKNLVYEATILRFYNRLTLAVQQMRAIDNQQMFEKDDDVGETFQLLLEAVDDLQRHIYLGTEDGDIANTD